MIVHNNVNDMESTRKELLFDSAEISQEFSRGDSAFVVHIPMIFHCMTFVKHFCLHPLAPSSTGGRGTPPTFLARPPSSFGGGIGGGGQHLKHPPIQPLRPFHQPRPRPIQKRIIDDTYLPLFDRPKIAP